MKRLRQVPSLAAGAIAFISISNLGAQSSTGSPAVSSEEIAIYATVLDTLPWLGPSSRPLIADSTSTFSCSKASCNGFLMGSCDGLRNEGETIADRMSLVKRDIPVLQAATASNFVGLNQACASIKSKIPTAADYRLFSDQKIPENWKYSYLVYFSRVGFNAEHTQALVYVGLVSSTNSKNSGGNHFILKMSSGKWILGEGSSFWQMDSPE
jgi:hypothetical protein